MNVTRGWGFLEGFLSKRRFATVVTLLDEVKNRGRILDLGCGPNARFLPLARFSDKFGIDLCLRSGAHRGANEIHLLRCDLQRTNPPLRPHSFDAITAIAFLEHLEEGRGAELIRSVYDLLKPNGILVLTTPALWTKMVLNSMAVMRLVSPEEITDHKAYYSQESIRQALVHAGFPIFGIRVGTFMAGANIWAIARKE